MGQAGPSHRYLQFPLVPSLSPYYFSSCTSTLYQSGSDRIGRKGNRKVISIKAISG